MKRLSLWDAASRWGVVVGALAAAMIGPAGAGAADGCFCLTHPVTKEVVYYGCDKAVPPNRFTPVVTCARPDGSGRQEVAKPGDYKECAGGVPPCNPCYPVQPGSPLPVPRGNGDAQ